MRRLVNRGLQMLLLATSIILIVAGCSSEGKVDGKLNITTTTGMIADIAKEVGGPYVHVIALMGSGIDPHLYQVSQGDIRKLDNADIIFYNGLHLEGKMVNMFEKLEKKKTTVAVSSALDPSQLMKDEGQGEDAYDPHIWFDVKMWMSAVEVVKNTLIEKDNLNKLYYEQQAAAYLEKLTDLDHYIHQQVKLIPEQQRILVTAHDAFGYFGRAYGITVTGLQGMNTMAEFGSRDISTLRDFLVENQIKAVFVESSVSPKAMESVIDGARILKHDVSLGGELFSDAMGEEGTPEGTYIGMVKHNIDTLVNALR
ncbi:metal ABC transporter solute-binding protein, Zn/Mn family [Paenibacillus yanchengensis]|uniref:Metal ABC transporter solute-binding protein, Zn/Mn family n=1 Tax=Paenibacillus yanchengensis TaxID=2035833 RepID=A0ABW4YPS3_9BACL